MLRKIPLGLVVFVLCVCNGVLAQDKVKKGIFEGKRKDVDLSNYHITLRLHNSLSYLTGVMEWELDSLAGKETNAIIRKNLLLLKYNLISVLSKTAFQSDPLLGAIDCWALGYQLVGYFADAKCNSLYGRHCEFLVNLFEWYLARYEKSLAPYVSSKSQQELKAFADSHPIRDDNLNRGSVVPNISAWISEDELGLKSSLLTMTDMMRDMNFRLQYYSEMLPKQAKWQMENTMIAYFMTDSISNLINNMENLMAVSAHTLAQTENMINFNRDTVLSNIDHQRIASLRLLQSERIAVLEGLSKERALILEAMQNERKAIEEFATHERLAMTSDVKTMGGEMMEGSLLVGKDIIDYIFIKSLILVAVLGILILAGIFLFKRMGNT